MKSYCMLSPYVRAAFSTEIPAPWTLQKRVIFDYELQYIQSGTIEVTINNQKYIGQPGDLFFYRPNEVHTMTILGNETLIQPHVHFDFYEDELSEAIKVSFKPLEEIPEEEYAYFRDDISVDDMYLPSHITLKFPNTIQSKLSKIIQLFHSRTPYYDLEMKEKMLDLWRHILLDYHHKPQALDQLEKIKIYIENHLNKNLVLDELAEKFFTNKFHLLRSFKKVYQITPIQFHSKLRLESAKSDIQYSELTLTEIADKYGYSSIHAFTRAFKKYDGVSPSYYKQK